MVSFGPIMDLDAAAWAALLLSLRVATVAMLCSLPLALWVAWILARKQFRGKGVLSALVHLPLVLPPVVTDEIAAHPSYGTVSARPTRRPSGGSSGP